MTRPLEGLPDEILVADLDIYRDDWWAASLMRRRAGAPKPEPIGAVRPRTVEEVSMVLRWASDRRIPVVPRGGGSGVCGGAEPGGDALVLDVGAMNAVLSIDVEAQVIRAQAGIPGPALEAALGEVGLTLGHWPQSFHISTLGGWVSTKSAGQMSTGYGNIEDRVLGLTVVLPDGSVAANRAFPRSAVGPEWWRLFLGAEGTLGVVTDVTLSAFAVPAAREWMGFEFTDFESGLSVMRKVMQSGIVPAVIRLYDEADAALNFSRNRSLAILRFEGSSGVVEAQMDTAAHIASAGGAIVTGPQDGETWWKQRFDAGDTYRNVLSGDGPLGRFAVLDTIEVSAFWPDLAAVYRAVRSALEGTGATVLAHASHMYPSGSGLYFTFFADGGESDDAADDLYQRCWEEAIRAAMDAGASLSHHHGIGLVRSRWVHEELGTGAGMIRRIKSALDPGGIMNPGKVGT